MNVALLYKCLRAVIDLCLVLLVEVCTKYFIYNFLFIILCIKKLEWLCLFSCWCYGCISYRLGENQDAESKDRILHRRADVQKQL
jgi:hypothetical protein